MKALVTGASGFLGSRLTAELQDKGVEVHTMGVRPWAGRHVILKAINDEQGIVDALANTKPDVVFHLAGATSAETRQQLRAVNAGFAEQIFRAMRRARCFPRTLVVGSAAEYGRVDPQDLPTAEDLPARPLTDYGKTKLEQTEAALRAARDGLPVVIARPFNVIGPGMRSHLVLAKVAERLAAIRHGDPNRELLLGDLSSTRDFIQIEHVTEAFQRLLTSDRGLGKIVNVCSGVERETRSLVQRMIEISELEVSIREDAASRRSSDAPTRSVGANERLQRLTGLQPTLDVDRTLSSLLEAALSR
jgi:nucleoside-diphosphate-sugar epimerase